MAARLAPEDMRGPLYGDLRSVVGDLGAMFGPSVGGFILDNYNPNLLWYLCGILAAVSVAGFLVLDTWTRQRLVV